MVESDDLLPPKYPEFGAAVSRLLTDLELSDPEVAKAIGVTREMVRRYRCGMALPRKTKMEKLAALLGLPPAELQYPGRKTDPRVSGPDATIPMVAVTPEERALLEAHRQLPEFAQKALRARAVQLLQEFGKASTANPFGKG